MILCAGEALIDMLPRKSAAGETAFAPHAGGAVFNTSIALGRLEVPTGFLCGISTDLFGKMLVETLDGAGVDAGLAPRSDRPTTLAFVTLTDGHASYAFYDENTAGRMLSPEDLPDLPDAVEALFLGGISLVVEPCAEAFEALLTREAARRVTMMDPNIRQSFITDEESYRARLERMFALVDVVKVSDEDLAWITGADDLDAGAATLLDKGVKLVCVTRGAEGATGVTKDFGVAVPARKAHVVDTVGAGDTFNAGVLASLHDGGALTKERIASLDEETVKAALSLGAQAAAVTVSRAGANPPRRHEIA